MIEMPKKKKGFDSAAGHGGGGTGSGKWTTVSSGGKRSADGRGGRGSTLEDAASEDARTQELRHLQEMFSEKLDPVVVHMIMEDCDFKVEVALEMLFQLSEQTSASESQLNKLSDFKNVYVPLMGASEAEGSASDDSLQREPQNFHAAPLPQSRPNVVKTRKGDPELGLSSETNLPEGAVGPGLGNPTPPEGGFRKADVDQGPASNATPQMVDDPSGPSDPDFPTLPECSDPERDAVTQFSRPVGSRAKNETLDAMGGYRESRRVSHEETLPFFSSLQKPPKMSDPQETISRDAMKEERSNLPASGGNSAETLRAKGSTAVGKDALATEILQKDEMGESARLRGTSGMRPDEVDRGRPSQDEIPSEELEALLDEIERCPENASEVGDASETIVTRAKSVLRKSAQDEAKALVDPPRSSGQTGEAEEVPKPQVVPGGPHGQPGGQPHLLWLNTASPVFVHRAFPAPTLTHQQHHPRPAFMAGSGQRPQTRIPQSHQTLSETLQMPPSQTQHLAGEPFFRRIPGSWEQRPFIAKSDVVTGARPSFGAVPPFQRPAFPRGLQPSETRTLSGRTQPAPFRPPIPPWPSPTRPASHPGPPSAGKALPTALPHEGARQPADPPRWPVANHPPYASRTRSESPAGLRRPSEDKAVPLPEGKVLCLMRGCPGSGKTTLAKKLVGNGKILSTDDFFINKDGKYIFDITRLSAAHDWTHTQARSAMESGVTPLVIDNTNIERWTMKPYVAMAVKYGYDVEFREPTTPWKFKLGKLTRYNSHGVPQETIMSMLERFERDVTVKNILGSCKPKKKAEPANRPASPSSWRKPGQGEAKAARMEGTSHGGHGLSHPSWRKPGQDEDEAARIKGTSHEGPDLSQPSWRKLAQAEAKAARSKGTSQGDSQLGDEASVTRAVPARGQQEATAAPGASDSPGDRNNSGLQSWRKPKLDGPPRAGRDTSRQKPQPGSQPAPRNMNLIEGSGASVSAEVEELISEISVVEEEATLQRPQLVNDQPSSDTKPAEDNIIILDGTTVGEFDREIAAVSVPTGGGEHREEGPVSGGSTLAEAGMTSEVRASEEAEASLRSKEKVLDEVTFVGKTTENQVASSVTALVNNSAVSTSEAAISWPSEEDILTGDSKNIGGEAPEEGSGEMANIPRGGVTKGSDDPRVIEGHQGDIMALLNAVTQASQPETFALGNLQGTRDVSLVEQQVKGITEEEFQSVLSSFPEAQPTQRPPIVRPKHRTDVEDSQTVGDLQKSRGSGESDSRLSEAAQGATSFQESLAPRLSPEISLKEEEASVETRKSGQKTDGTRANLRTLNKETDRSLTDRNEALPAGADDQECLFKSGSSQSAAYTGDLSRNHKESLTQEKQGTSYSTSPVVDSSATLSDLNLSLAESDTLRTPSPTNLPTTPSSSAESHTKRHHRSRNQKRPRSANKIAAVFPSLSPGSGDWSELAVQEPRDSLGLAGKPCAPATDSGPSKCHSGTVTLASDFAAVQRLSSGRLSAKDLEGQGLRVVCGRARQISADASAAFDAATGKSPETGASDSSGKRSPIMTTLSLHKSTMTDSEEPVSTVDGKLRDLTFLFPSVPPGDLEDILARCWGDVQWATNLLLDDWSGLETEAWNHQDIEGAPFHSQTSSNGQPRQGPSETGTDIGESGPDFKFPAQTTGSADLLESDNILADASASDLVSAAGNSSNRQKKLPEDLAESSSEVDEEPKENHTNEPAANTDSSSQGGRPVYIEGDSNHSSAGLSRQDKAGANKSDAFITKQVPVGNSAHHSRETIPYHSSPTQTEDQSGMPLPATRTARTNSLLLAEGGPVQTSPARVDLSKSDVQKPTEVEVLERPTTEAAIEFWPTGKALTTIPEDDRSTERRMTRQREPPADDFRRSFPAESRVGRDPSVRPKSQPRGEVLRQPTASLPEEEEFGMPHPEQVMSVTTASEEFGKEEDEPWQAGEEEEGQALPRKPRVLRSLSEGLMLQLPAAFALQLQEMFGPVGFHLRPDGLPPEDLQVCVDYPLAKSLHSLWAQTLQARFNNDEELEDIIQSDEELARRLQQEEDIQHLSKVQSERSAKYLGSKGSPKRRWHPNAEGNKDAVAAALASPGRPTPPLPVARESGKSFQEIIDEELAVQLSKDVQVEEKMTSRESASIATKLKRNELYEKFPTLDRDILEDMYRSNDYQLGPTIKHVRALFLSSAGQPRNVYSKEALEKMEKELIDRVEKESLASSEGTDDSSESNYQSAVEPDYEDYRAEATQHYRLRHEAFQKAASAYNRGQRELASFYSQQGHLHTEKLKAANRRASEAILYSKNSVYQENTLDLHGLHVDEALSILDQVLADRKAQLTGHSGRQTGRSPLRHLFVITGKGNHSKGGVARLRPAVTEVLKKGDYKYTMVNAGLIKVVM